jgi:hypothetical protein
MASIKLRGDTSGEVTIQAPAVAGTTTLNLPATSSTLATQNSLGVRNLIINGDMRIDQRNAGASASISGTNIYYIDRWNGRIVTGSGHTIQQVTDAPSDIINSLKVTIGTGGTPASTDRAFINQFIEGLNMSHLNWGSSSATQITLSFYVKSSLTGTFGGAIQNGSNAYSYPFTYAISSANTWERKSITIEGPTSGTFSTDNSIGMVIRLDLGTGSNYQGASGSWSANDYRAASGCTQLVGTSGATFYITGVQLEVGDTATPFEHRPYDMELLRCQRYFFRDGYGLNGASAGVTGPIGLWYTSSDLYAPYYFPVEMRAAPTVSSPAVTGGYRWHKGASYSDVNNFGTSFTSINRKSMYTRNGQVSGGTAGQAAWAIFRLAGTYVELNAEL